MDFTDEQQATLKAAMNCIIPADEYPNAWDAGVGNFLFKLLDGDLAHLQETYATGLDDINTASQDTYQQNFAQLTDEQQNTLLSEIENGENAAFFNMLAEHTIEGYYSDPGNGGNKDQIAWQMIGYQVKQWHTTTQS